MDMLWLDFLNTDCRDWRGTGNNADLLIQPDRVERILNRWELRAPVIPSEEELAQLRAWRDILRQMAETVVAGLPLKDADLALLNGYMKDSPLLTKVTSKLEAKGAAVYSLVERGQEPGWRAVMGQIALSFARTLAENEPSRIRICGNPDCLWVFYDDTRSRSKRYCDDSMCGNLMKVRRFRAKRKKEE